MEISFESIARICHEANRAYCETLGDRSGVMWLVASKELKASAVDGVKAIFENPHISKEELHERWSEQKIKNGWKFGEKKNEAKKEHPCLLPYDKLPSAQKIKDNLFHAIVRSFIVE